jgi:hypothetical protein
MLRAFKAIDGNQVLLVARNPDVLLSVPSEESCSWISTDRMRAAKLNAEPEPHGLPGS